MVRRANFERQLCESVFCSNLTSVSCRYKGAQLVPPPKREREGAPKRNGWLKKGFFKTLPYLTLEVKNATRIKIQM